MTVNKQSRDAFEAWAREQPSPLNLGFGNGGYYYAPDTIRAWELWQAARADLLARNAELEALANERMRAVNAWATATRECAERACEFERDRDALAAENKALRENAERYEWLRDNAKPDDIWYDDVVLRLPAPDIDGFDSLDEIVDAARTPAATTKGNDND